MQAGRNAARQTDVDKDKCTSRHTCTYRLRCTDRQTDRQTDGTDKHRMGGAWQECRRAGMQAGRNAGGQECRQTDGCRERQVDIHVQLHTYRNKDIQTYTDEQTDRQCRSAGRQAEKHTDVQ